MYFLFLATFLLRLPTLWTPIVDIDESIFALCAEVIRQGGVLYQGCVDHQPPGIYWFFSLLFSIFGPANMIAVHAVTSLIVFVTALLIRKIGGDKAGFWAALFYVVFSTTHIPKYISTNIEIIANLPLVLSAWLLVRRSCQGSVTQGRFAQGGRMGDFCVGLLGGLAIILKYQAGLIVLAFLPALKPRRLLWVFLGGFVFAAVFLGKMIHDGNLSSFLQETLLRGWQYAHLGSSENLFWSRLAARLGLTIATSWVLWVAALRGVLHPGQVSRRLLFLWFGGAFIGVCLGARFYPHYFILLLPPLCLLAGPPVASFWQKSGALKRSLGVALVSCWALFFLILRLDVQKTYRWFYQNYASFDSGVEPMSHEKIYRDVAGYLARNSQPSDRLVVWGFADPIYFFSQRLLGTRYVWADDLTGRVPGAPRTWQPDFDTAPFVRKEAWDIFIRELQENKPLWFVDTAAAGLNYYGKYPVDHYPRLWDILQRDYRKVVTIDSVDLYQRQE